MVVVVVVPEQLLLQMVMAEATPVMVVVEAAMAHTMDPGIMVVLAQVDTLVAVQILANHQMVQQHQQVVAAVQVVGIRAHTVCQPAAVWAYLGKVPVVAQLVMDIMAA
jgi:hypothetical protein